ncbi:hypothetical protein L1987_07926 [Smallanthus sonchifolius]|uniref:Uncharacterized protein n=1 Tax=Smallanthus sonchifolius TaxID=185202 RepID=A0ACB9JJA9_9ASTR|nr:hypothetical protein L1987_07926 [Smallanthus sonchifolius]
MNWKSKLNWNFGEIDLFVVRFYLNLKSRAQGEPSFHLFGFIMCLAATAGRALKSVLQGILLSSVGLLFTICYRISMSAGIWAGMHTVRYFDGKTYEGLDSAVKAKHFGQSTFPWYTLTKRHGPSGKEDSLQILHNLNEGMLIYSRLSTLMG